MRHLHLMPILLLALAPLSPAWAADTPQSAPSAVATPGDTKQNAVEVCGPAGERAYMATLQCESGEQPAFSRVGSFGSRNKTPGNLTEEQRSALTLKTMTGKPLAADDVDLHVVDGYELSCGAVKRMVFLDMYHCAK